MPEALRSIHVVAGVIQDARGRILLTRRTEGRDLAGRWEFPGGKRESGETSEQALVRELEEELGIRAEVGDWIIDVPQRYPDKRLRLEVRRIRSFKGTPRGHEGQAMLWVMPDRLDRYDMPPADKPVVGALLQPDRLLITSGTEVADDVRWLASLEQALRSGVRRVLLRLPETGKGQRQPLAEQAVALCKGHGAQALVHEDVSLATALGAGLHLSRAQLMTWADRPVGAEVPLAASCDAAETLAAAEKLRCDFAVVGVSAADAASNSPKSPDWPAFEQLREATSLPLYAAGVGEAIGTEEVRRHGGQGVAMTGASWCAAD